MVDAVGSGTSYTCNVTGEIPSEVEGLRRGKYCDVVILMYHDYYNNESLQLLMSVWRALCLEYLSVQILVLSLSSSAVQLRS